jgi:hypothetical protein
MSTSLTKLWNDYGLAGILLSLVVVYVLYMLFNYFMNKGMTGSELMSGNYNKAYSNENGDMTPMPAQDIQTANDVFSSVNDMGSTANGNALANSSCPQPSVQNPADLLPKDTNSEWAQLNPAGMGELSNINLLKAGYHIGIDTVGQTLRNANLQIRSEPPNPQVNVGPWNNSTITSDFLRVPLELGQGSQ